MCSRIYTYVLDSGCSGRWVGIAQILMCWWCVSILACVRCLVLDPNAVLIASASHAARAPASQSSNLQFCSDFAADAGRKMILLRVHLP